MPGTCGQWQEVVFWDFKQSNGGEEGGGWGKSTG